MKFLLALIMIMCSTFLFSQTEGEVIEPDYTLTYTPFGKSEHQISLPAGYETNEDFYLMWYEKPSVGAQLRGVDLPISIEKAKDQFCASKLQGEGSEVLEVVNFTLNGNEAMLVCLRKTENNMSMDKIILITGNSTNSLVVNGCLPSYSSSTLELKQSLLSLIANF